MEIPGQRTRSSCSPRLTHAPKAQGIGRSGPRRRTGCLTCRARKVRCDETKPRCANCDRLRLQCAYKTPGTLGNRSWGRVFSPQTSNESPAAHAATAFSPTPPMMGPSSAAAAASASQRSPDLTYFNTVLRSDEHRRAIPASAPPARRLAPHTQSYPSELGGPFDMLGIMGGITSELEQKHLDLTSGSAALSTPQSLQAGVAVDNTEETLSAAERRSPLSPDASSSLVDGISAGSASDATLLPCWSAEWSDMHEGDILLHFAAMDPPAAIFGPVDMEWKYVRPFVLAHAPHFSPLLNAVCCYADVHKARLDGKQWRRGQLFHRMACSNVQACLVGDVSDSTLVKVFAAVFMLMLAELSSSSELCSSGTSYLHSAYLLLQRFHDRTRTWTGLGHLLVSWISLLDVKSLIAGRDGDPLIEQGDIAETSSDALNAEITQRTTAPACPSHDRKEDTIGDPIQNASYLVYDAIVGPAFRFFVQAQQVVRRIVCIDLHHRSRGTLSDEYEVLQIAHKVGADLETLWHRRPPVIDIYANPESLTDTLHTPIALAVCRTFRQYVANFLANFIYLHRVAFAIYPRTDRVNGAVDQIIQLATVESAGAGPGQLPVSFLWPLFVAGLEGSQDQRQWIVQEIQRMAGQDAESGTSMARHPAADKVLLLLEEMTRRQDASRTWADSRCVRRELFSDPFVMI